MAAYYNEIDPKAAAWLRNLIAAGHIAPGDVDERSIVEVRPDELAGYTQCHFFAGVGVWSYALRLAGWPDDRPVWTGSCPCQPFSAAGKGEGLDDPRHLWPDWFRLIREQRPVVVFGEQVAGPDGVAWLDLAQADLEEHSHTVGAVVTCSAGFGGPDIRQRLYWVADAGSERRQQEHRGASGDEEAHGRARRVALEPNGDHVPAGGLEAGRMADTANGDGRRGERGEKAGTWPHGERGRGSAGGGAACGVGDTADEGCEGRGEQDLPGARRWSEGRSPASPGVPPGGLADTDGGTEGDGGIQRGGQHGLEPQDSRVGGVADAGHAEWRPRDRTRDEGGQHVLRQDREEGPVEPRERGEDVRPGPLNGFWRVADWLLCTDGKWRPVEPGTFPLDTGIAGRLVRLRAYGNALNAEAAKEFIGAYLEVKHPHSQFNSKEK